VRKRDRDWSVEIHRPGDQRRGAAASALDLHDMQGMVDDDWRRVPSPQEQVNGDRLEPAVDRNLDIASLPNALSVRSLELGLGDCDP
jgi:hypothetical protein